LDPTPGARLGPYEIVARLAEGGMGEVYKALDTRLDLIVAVKVSKTAFDPRFEPEARSIAALNHAHICTLYDVGPDSLVMARVDPRKGRVIELRFFGGLSAEETAAVLEVSTKTVLRDWTFARAWLQREMTAEAGTP
jgi:serine/threonine protein kinase